jgi:fucose permease
MFIVGSGLSTLETSANPYIAVCGPPKWSEFRLELSQSFQAIGSVVAPVLASFVIFKNVGTDGKSLEAVQYVYLGIAAFVGILAVVFYFVPLPEITDADMADQAEMTTMATGYVDKPMRKQYTLFFGVAAQFSYVGVSLKHTLLQSTVTHTLLRLKSLLPHTSSTSTSNADLISHVSSAKSKAQTTTPSPKDCSQLGDSAPPVSCTSPKPATFFWRTRLSS